MKHTRCVERFDGTMVELAESIGDLYYDSLAEFLDRLSEKLARDAAADAGRNRPRLAKELSDTSRQVQEAAKHVREAWRICAPHMPDRQD